MKNIKFYLTSCLGLAMLCCFFSVGSTAEMGRGNTLKSSDGFGPTAPSNTLAPQPQVEVQPDCNSLQTKIAGGGFVIEAVTISPSGKHFMVRGLIYNRKKKLEQLKVGGQNIGVEVKLTAYSFKEDKDQSERLEKSMGKNQSGVKGKPLSPEVKVFTVCAELEKILRGENEADSQVGGSFFIPLDLGVNSFTVTMDPDGNIQDDENKNDNTIKCRPFIPKEIEAEPYYMGGYSGECSLF